MSESVADEALRSIRPPLCVPLTGRAVFGGMILATFVGIFMIPPLYVFVARFLGRRQKEPDETHAEPVAAAKWTLGQRFEGWHAPRELL